MKSVLRSSLLDLSFYALSTKPSLSLVDGAAKLLVDNASWTSTLGQAANVTYGFRQNVPTGTDYSDSEKSTFSRIDASEAAAIRLAITAWSDVANIHFTDTGATNNAAILFSNYSADDGADSIFGARDLL